MALFANDINLDANYGSEEKVFGVRVWCQHNSSHSVLGSGGLSSLTDNGTGDSIFNFSNTLPDANYSFVSGTSLGSAVANQQLIGFSATNCRTKTRYYDLNSYNSTVTMMLVR
tara:strand:- start:160 stop:498 length:339 start_codon:yes stop_codon:yes gene_type:complete